MDNINDVVQLKPCQLVSSTKLVRSLSKYLDLAKKTPVFISRENEIEVVMLSLEDYRSLLERGKNSG